MTNYKIISNALAVLESKGLFHFKEHLRETIHRYAAIGAALAVVEVVPSVPARLAHEYWEEHNQHTLAALMRWLFPKELNPSGVLYLYETVMIKHLLEREHIILLDADGQSKGYTVTVNIEEQRVDMIASGYDWMCPHCEHMNHEIEALNDVQCIQCRTHYTINPPEHAYE